MISTLYLLEHSQKISQVIVNTAIKNGFEIYIFKKFSDLLIDLKRHRPDVIIINEKLLPESYDEFLAINNYQIIVYGDRIDLDRKLNLYEMGVSRVLELPFFQPELLIQTFSNQQKLLQHKTADSVSSKRTTTLQKLSINELLESVVSEKKSFTLKIADNGWYGYLKITGGNIERVRCTSKTGADALLDILFHPRGNVTLKFHSQKETNSISPISVPGILTEYRYQMDCLYRFKSKLSRPNPVFQRTENNPTTNFSPQEELILSLIEKNQTLKQICQKSPLSMYQTLTFLDKMIEQKIINVLDDPRNLEKFSEEDIELFVEQVLPSGKHRGQVLVLGSTEPAKKILMENLKKIFSAPLFSNKSLDTCEISVEQETRLYFIGMPLDDYLREDISEILKHLAGIIYVIDFSQALEFDYKKYVLRQILNEHDVPLAIGFINLTRMTDEVISEFKRKLEIPDELPIVSLDPNKFSDMEALIMQLVGVSTQEPQTE